MSFLPETLPESEALLDSMHSSRRTFLSTGIAAAAVAAAPRAWATTSGPRG